MRRRGPLLLVCVALAVLVPAATAHATVSQLRVTLSQPARQLPVLDRLGLDVTEDVGPDWAVVIAHSAADRELLRANGFGFTTEIADMSAYTRAARAADARRARGPGRSALPSGRNTYRTLADYMGELDALAAGHAGLVRKITLPRASVEGRPLVGVEIAGDVNRDDDGRPVYVVMGLHHAREWPSGEVSMEFAVDLVNGYGTDPRITSLLDRERVFVIPVINPDGFEDSRGDAPAASNTGDALKRRNCRAVGTDDPSAACISKRGVDLNRNYGAYWGGNGASVSPGEDTYRGPSPWSEPESAAVHEFSQRLQITNIQSLHNVAALVLRPPGFKALGLAPDEARLKGLGDAMAAATGYESQYGYELYEVTGATEDWNYVSQGSFGYTIELGGDAVGAPTFQGPYQTHVVDQYLGSAAAGTQGKGVREALLLAGEEAADPTDHAIVQGSAPAGARLRLHRDFLTTTSPICTTDTLDSAGNCATTSPAFTIPDFLDTTLTVPAGGHFTWHVGPSTRPFDAKAGLTSAWTLTCEQPVGKVVASKQVTVGRGQTVGVSACDPNAAVSDPFTTPGTQPVGTTPTKAKTKVRLVVGRQRISERTAARRRTLRLVLRLRGGTLHDITAVLRDGDRQVLSRAKRKGRASKRAAVVLKLRKPLVRGTYRASVTGVTAAGVGVEATARIQVVRARRR